MIFKKLILFTLLFLSFSAFSQSFGDFLFVSKCKNNSQLYCAKGEYRYNQTVTLVSTNRDISFCDSIFGKQEGEYTTIKDFSNCFDEFDFELAIVGVVGSYRAQELDSINDRETLDRARELLDSQGIEKSFIVYKIDNLTSIYLVHLNDSNNTGQLYQLYNDKLTRLSDHCAKTPSLFIIRGNYYLLTHVTDCEQGDLGKVLFSVSRDSISKVISEVP